MADLKRRSKRNGQFRTALLTYLRSLKKQKGRPRTNAFWIGRSLYREGQYPEALMALTIAIRQHPGNELYRHLRGETYAALGKHRRAIRDYTRALEITRGSKGEYLCRRAELFARTGEISSALKDLYAAIRIDPTDTEPRMLRSTLLMKAGKNREAVRELDRIITMDPANGKAYFLRGMIRSQSKRKKDLLEAILDLSAARQNGVDIPFTLRVSV